METVLLGGVLSGQGRIVEGDLALKALGHYRPSRALIAVDHIAEDGTLSVRQEASARLLSEAVAQSERVRSSRIVRSMARSATRLAIAAN
jgi:DeoR/GlpR family transcriptional regulator of sugar metabolism